MGRESSNLGRKPDPAGGGSHSRARLEVPHLNHGLTTVVTQCPSARSVEVTRRFRHRTLRDPENLVPTLRAGTAFVPLRGALEVDPRRYFRPIRYRATKRITFVSTETAKSIAIVAMM
jgi:hypothetical protein